MSRGKRVGADRLQLQRRGADEPSEQVRGRREAANKQAHRVVFHLGERVGEVDLISSLGAAEVGAWSATALPTPGWR